MSTHLLSYHGDKKLKAIVLRQMKNHAEADELIKGVGWEEGKGCMVGCLLHDYNHKKGEEALGWPEWLLRLCDSLFENIDNGGAKKFALALPKAVPIGVNLDPVKWKFCSFILQENIERVESLKNIDEKLRKQVIDAVKKCKAVHDNATKTGKWDKSAARSAWSAAESAARSARSAAESAARSAWSAAESAAESAWSAAESAAESARSAAESAAESARSAAESAWSAAYQRYANKLIKLLKEAT